MTFNFHTDKTESMRSSLNVNISKQSSTSYPFLVTINISVQSVQVESIQWLKAGKKKPLSTFQLLTLLYDHVVQLKIGT